MTAKYFLDSVILMRKAQREYKRTNNIRWLAEAQRLEKIVDSILSNYKERREEIEPAQLNIFQE